MRTKTKVIDAILAFVGIAGLGSIALGLMWLGKLDARLDALEKKLETLHPQSLAIGARGQSCIEIANKLTRAAENKDARAQGELERLADKWGCAVMPMSHDLPRPNSSLTIEPNLPSGLENMIQ